MTELDFLHLDLVVKAEMARDNKKNGPSLQSKEHPPAKPSISKTKSSPVATVDRNTQSQLQNKGAGLADIKKKEVQHPDRKKEDLDDMDEIFSSKPSKQAKSRVLDGAKISSSGPDMAEIAKEAEKYKGSSSQGLLPPGVIFQTTCTEFNFDFNLVSTYVVLHCNGKAA